MADDVPVGRETFAFIFPYRHQTGQDRFAQLEKTLAGLAALSTKRAESTLFVLVEQSDDGQLFNRGALLNAGVRYASDYCKRRNWPTKNLSLIFHDVDLSPSSSEDGALDNYFGPLHAGRVRALGRAWLDCPYASDKDFLGGVSRVSYPDFKASCGFPNNYWGWGGEEVCWRYRVRAAGLRIEGPRPGMVLIDGEGEGGDRPPRTNKCPVRWELKREWEADVAAARNNYADLACDMNRVHSPPPLVAAAKGGGTFVHVYVSIDPVAHVAPPSNDSLTEAPYVQLPSAGADRAEYCDEEGPPAPPPSPCARSPSPPPVVVEVVEHAPPPAKKARPDGCIGTKKDGGACSKKHRKGMSTCYSHRAQEPKD